MYSSTGLSSEQITDLVARIHDLREAPASRAGRKPTLGLYKCVVVALIYLRSNRTQASIADQFHVSQKTISRTIASWMPILGQALQDLHPHGRRPRCQRTTHRRWHPTADLVMAHHARTVLRQTQNHRCQRPGCVRPDRTARLRLRPDARLHP